MIPMTFKSKDDVVTLLQVLQYEDVSFHPDKPFDTYIDPSTGQPRYDAEKIALRTALLTAAQQFCSNHCLDLYRIYKEACIRVDLKAKLTGYFPVLFELLENEPFDWKTINDKFSTNHLRRLTNYIHGDREPMETNFYDVIAESLNGNPQGQRMVTFFRGTLEQLARSLDSAGRKKIKDTLYNLLIEMDLNYLNYIGELSVLNVFLWNKAFRLHAIESPLGNGNGADFSLEPVSGGKPTLIEVVNIRPRTYPNSPDILKKFLEGKLSEKIQKKTKGDMTYLTFRLVPVICGSADELAWTAKLLKGEITLNVPNITDPCAFATFPDKERGGTFFRFGTLDSLFP